MLEPLNLSKQSLASNSSAVPFDYISHVAFHLPDVLLDSISDLEIPCSKEFYGVVLFADVSGFTALCEKYENSKPKASKPCESGENGINDLTKTLNNYLGQVLEILLHANADIYKFAGDAILCHWQIDNELTNETISKALNIAIKASIDIQSYLGNYKTTTGVTLKIKLAIAHGSYIFHVVGNESYKNIIAVGPAIKEVNKVEKVCNAGDIIISSDSWLVIQQHTTYLYRHISDSNHVKIIGFHNNDLSSNTIELNSSANSSSHNSYCNESNKSNTLRYYKKSIIEPSVNLSDLYTDSIKINNKVITSKSKKFESIKKLVFDYLDIRKNFKCLKSNDFDDALCGALNTNCKIKVRKFFTQKFSKFEIDLLKTFIIESILRKIKDNQPLEFLSELRYVTIVFINLSLIFDNDPVNDEKPGVTLKSDQTAVKLTYKDVGVYQKLFNTIHENIILFGGVLSKTITFDKGSSFLCVFGLPGVKDANEACHALTCAHILHEKLNQIEFVKNASIGITTGLTFTGVIGHPFRFEYTVIGSKVNLAARLMANYPGIITCDNNTYSSSKLPKNYFNELPVKEMKGFSYVGVIREYKEKNCDEISDIESFEYPIVGRENELKLITDYMNESLNFNNDLHKDLKKDVKRKFIIVSGDNGIGKTRMLDAIIQYAEHLNNIKVVSLNAKIDNTNIKYSIMVKVIVSFFKMNKLKHAQRENIFSKLFSNKKQMEYLHLFNDLFKTNFPKPTNHLNLTNDEKDRLIKAMSYNAIERGIKSILAKNGRTKYLVLVIDDIHNCDSFSWSFLYEITQIRNFVLIVSFGRRSNYTLHMSAKQLIDDPNALKVELKGLDIKYLTTVACQMLGVQKIASVLNRIIIEKSQGIPAWCEELLRELYLNSYIQIVSLSALNEHDLKYYVDGIKSYLTKKKQKASILHSNRTSSNTRVQIQSHKQNNQMVCKVVNNVDLNRMNFPEGMQNQVLARIDRLNEDDAFVIKTAAILGVVFLKSMLEYVLENRFTYDRIQQSIQRLVQQSIFKCASAPTTLRDTSLQNHEPDYSRITQSKVITCYCFPLKSNESANDARKTIIETKDTQNCKLLSFNAILMQEVSVKLFTDQVSCKIHLKAAEFLESQKWNCRACGGDNLVLGLSPEKYNYLVSYSPLKLADMVNMLIKRTHKGIPLHNTQSNINESVTQCSTLSKTQIIEREEAKLMDDYRKSLIYQIIENNLKEWFLESKKILKFERYELNWIDDNGVVNKKFKGFDMAEVSSLDEEINRINERLSCHQSCNKKVLLHKTQSEPNSIFNYFNNNELSKSNEENFTIDDKMWIDSETESENMINDNLKSDNGDNGRDNIFNNQSIDDISLMYFNGKKKSFKQRLSFYNSDNENEDYDDDDEGYNKDDDIDVDDNDVDDEYAYDNEVKSTVESHKTRTRSKYSLLWIKAIRRVLESVRLKVNNSKSNQDIYVPLSLHEKRNHESIDRAVFIRKKSINNLNTLLIRSTLDGLEPWIDLRPASCKGQRKVNFFPLHRVSTNFSALNVEETKSEILKSMKKPGIISSIKMKFHKSINKVIKPLQYHAMNIGYLNQNQRFRKFKQQSLTTISNENDRKKLVETCDISRLIKTDAYFLRLHSSNKPVVTSSSTNRLSLYESEIIISSSCYGDDEYDEEKEYKMEQVLDVRNCACHLILSVILPQLIKHLNAAGKIDRTYFFMIELAACLLANNKSFTAYETLTESMKIYKTWKEHSSISSLPFVSYDLKAYDEARLYNLLGLAHFQLNEIDKSLECFQKSLSFSFGKPFNFKRFSKLKLIKRKFKLWLYWVNLKCPVSVYLSDFKYRCYEEASFSLTYLYEIYKKNFNYAKCSIIAYTHAYLAEKINTDLKMIMCAYYELIDQNSFYANYKLNLTYINHAIKISKRNLKTISDFQSLSKIYYLSFINNFSNGKLKIALKHGLIVKTLLSHIHDNEALIKVYPELILCSLAVFDNINSILNLITQFELITLESNQIIATLWYYCLCIDVSFVFNNDESFSKYSIDDFVEKLNDPLCQYEAQITFYFYTTLMIYYCRKNDFISAEKYYRLSIDSKFHIKYNSFLFASSVLKLIEYQLLLYSQVLAENKDDEINLIIKSRLYNFLIINQKTDIFKPFPIFKVKLMHYKAYYSKLVEKYDLKTVYYLSKAIKLAENMNMCNEYNFIMRSLLGWYDLVTSENELKQENVKNKCIIRLLNLFKINLKTVEATFESILKIYLLPLPSNEEEDTFILSSENLFCD